ncbi:hypothetical protein SISNIDRAFT_486857 [Sistotremastrum niveocremeum HHB9708]|uniref:BTB domain-containing protein n=1 Tax=Sistotremastrum niveocremeum HHB9708 TaxID=1314777 RepID=A0A164SYB6_9AGAM|nr:hypothetical protein SISNIDRAFT_486857 [Sistotremastrum niveocremeum HHB9708]
MASSTTDETSSLAQASEFFAFPNSDLTIVTADKIKFSVHKLIMSMVSEVFKDMVSLDEVNPSHPHSENSTAPPSAVVDVTESSSTMNIILRMIYHAPREGTPSFEEISAMLETIDKYQMSGLWDVAQDIILTHPLLKQNSLRVYAISKKYSLKRVSDAILPFIVSLDFRTLSLSEIPRELDNIPFSEYLKLSFYAKQRASLILKKIETVSMPGTIPICTCRRDKTRVLPTYISTLTRDLRCVSWAKFVELAKLELEKTPDSSVLRDEIRVRAANEVDCPFALKWMFEGCKTVFVALRASVDATPWSFEDEYNR